MRKLLLTVLGTMLVGVPSAAFASARTPADGTLAVRDASGTITIKGTGGFIGRFDRGVVKIVDPIEEDGGSPFVSGCETRDVHDRPILGGSVAICTGTWIRFRLVGGKFNVKIKGTGIDLSVVGRGTVTLDGEGGNDGRYSLNGDDFRSMPNLEQTFLLSAPAPAEP